MDQRFDELVAPFRRELEAHCYRMLGSLADAEDQVQETLLRAWRNIDGFEGRASMRAWLYKIATNGCIDLLRRRPTRIMPSDVGAPADPEAPLLDAPAELPWVDPAPARLWQGAPSSPEAQFSERESVQLAFIVALQCLPATQRSVLILRDVLGWSAAEVAELLETSVASVNSALQRARATLDERRARMPPAPRAGDAATQALLARYVEVWQRADVDALVTLLHEDVVMSMPPLPAWFQGREPVASFTRGKIGSPGGLRLLPILGADEGAFAVYRKRAGETAYHAHAVHVLQLSGGLVAGLHVFLQPALFARFGAPDRLDD